MKLLFVDKKDIATFARLEVLRDQYHHQVDYASTFDEFLSEYAVDKYHIVILDFAVEAGAKAIEYIDRTDPKQRVIIISVSEAYSEPNGCVHCAGHFNRHRLKEPVGVMDLANAIRDFDYAPCAHYRD